MQNCARLALALLIIYIYIYIYYGENGLRKIFMLSVVSVSVNLQVEGQ